MDAARLVALLELDDKSFTAAMDAAKTRVGGFDITMRQAGRTLSTSSRLMTGFGMASAGAGTHAGRLASQITGLLSAFAVNPIYAVVAALSALTAYLSNQYAAAQDKALEKTKALNAEFERRQRILHHNLGMDKTDAERNQEEISGLSETGNVAGLKEISERLNQKKYDAYNRLMAVQKVGTEKQRNDAQDAYGFAVVDAGIAEKAYRKALDKKDELDRKRHFERSERSRKQYEMQVDEEMRLEDEKAAKTKHTEKAVAEIKADYRGRVAGARAGEGISVRDWGSDSVARIGGQIGGQINPQLRQIDRQIQIQHRIESLISEGNSLIREALAQ